MPAIRNSHLPSKLAEVLGVTSDAKERIRSYNFSGDNVDEPREREDTFTCILAPSYGIPKASSLQTMDKELKIVISATTRAISEIKPRDRTWENVYATLLQSPLLEQYGDEHVKIDRLDRDGHNWFKFTTDKQEEMIIRDVDIWFNALLSDDDVRQATPIDIRGLATVVAATGAKVENLLSLTNITQDVAREKTVLDVGVLRYPDISHPYFKVYRIQLNAWGYSKNALGVRINKNGIAGHYTCCKFKPRLEVIAKVSEEAQNAAAREAEELLGFQPSVALNARSYCST